MLNLTQSIPLYGDWKIENDNCAVFEPKRDRSANDKVEPQVSHGLLLSTTNVADGWIECEISLSEIERGGAAIVFRAEGQSTFYAAGIGGWDSGFSLLRATNMQFSRLAGVGSISNLTREKPYKVRVQLEGQRADILVDGVKLISYSSLEINEPNSVGLFSFNSTRKATFRALSAVSSRPKAFVAMQFSEPYNEVYRDAIEPLIVEIGFDAIRIDDVNGPGVIINDILSNLYESSIVVVEVSEKNPNVYYELGIAHALAKPTILLAVKGTSLPFDVAPNRCIFYENTIPGRGRLQQSLKRALASILKLPIS